MSFIDDSLDVSKVTGNASDTVKRVAIRPSNIVFVPNSQGKRGGFADQVATRLQLTDATFLPYPDGQTERVQHKLTYELTVEEDMVNTSRTLHGGCAAYLVDLCSSLVIVCYAFHSTGELVLHVSQSLNMVYHAPAFVGSKLRIINSTVSIGRRVASAKTDIWDVENHRLVASGTHVKMLPGKDTERVVAGREKVKAKL